jgi:hypothetical protein
MHTPAKVALAVIGVIVVALGIMLVIGFIEGDDMHKQDGQNESNSASVVSWPAPSALAPAS